MASFETYKPLLKQVEAGFQKDPNDPGNYNSLGQLVGTNLGISARFYESIIGRPPTEADMRALTSTKADPIFKTYFWDAAKGDNIKNQSIANTVVDHQINAGSGVKLAQQVLNNRFGYNMAEDNGMGPITLKAINEVNPSQFVTIYNDARADYYRSIGNSTFLSGWLTRLNKFAYNNKALTLSTGAMLVIGFFFVALYNLNKD